MNNIKVNKELYAADFLVESSRALSSSLSDIIELKGRYMSEDAFSYFLIIPFTIQCFIECKSKNP
jgi:hypothetical protein